MKAQTIRNLLLASFLLTIASGVNAQSISVDISEKNDNSEVYSNDVVKLSWESDSAINIDYSIDSGASWLNIATALSPETKTFEWTVPEVDSSKLIVKLSHTESVQIPLTVKNLKLNDTYYKWWKVANTAPFEERDGAGALVFKNKMWLLGGWNPSKYPVCNSEVWSSGDGTNWKLETIAPWEGRHTAGYVVFKDKMWVIGGDINSGHYQNDVWNTDDGINWVKVTDSLPWKDRVLFYTTVFKDRIYVIGGQRMTTVSPQELNLDPSELYSDVWSTTDGVNWTKELEQGPWLSRGLISGSAVLNGHIWMLGGGTYAQTIPRQFYNDVWNTADGKSWKQVSANAGWAPREYQSVLTFDNKLWIVGGYGRTGNLDDTWYSADGVQWEKVTPSFYDARHAASAFVFQNSIWLTGGPMEYRDMWRLIKKANTINLSQQSDTLLYHGDSLYIRTDRIVGGSYQWLRNNEPVIGVNENYIRVKSTGNYHLNFTDLEGETNSSSPVSVSFIDKKIAPFSDTTILWGDTTLNMTLQVDPVQNAKYEWYKNGNLIDSEYDRLYTAREAGDYYVKVSLPNGVSKQTDTVRVSEYKPELSRTSENLLFSENQVTLAVRFLPGVRYQWFRNGVQLRSSTDTSITVSDIGAYHVVLTTNSGYSYLSDTVRISTGVDNSKLEIRAASITNGNLSFHVFSDEEGAAMVELLGVGGRMYLKEQTVKSGATLNYSKYIPSLPKGYYIMRVTMKNKTGTVKISN